MVKRMMVWMLGVAVLLLTPVASGQWADIHTDEPHNLGYDHLAELSELLELDAPVHEILIGLHLEMMRAESEKRQEVRAQIAKLEESGARMDWNEGIRVSMQLMEDFDAIADGFYSDVKLLVQPEQFPLIEHIRQRRQMQFLFRMTGDEISGLSAQPFELLHEKDLVPVERFREIVLAHRATEAKAHDQYERAMASIFEMQQEMWEFDFEVENADTNQIAKMTRLFKDTVNTMKRLRDLNESLADEIMASLDEQNRTLYKEAWLDANYEDVQEETLPELAARRVLEDDVASEELVSRVREVMPNFERRLTTARKMARIAKHKSDLNFDFHSLIDSDGPDREMYEESLERLSEVAETYAAALKRAMTPEQRVKYGLEAADE